MDHDALMLDTTKCITKDSNKYAMQNWVVVLDLDDTIIRI